MSGDPELVLVFADPSYLRSDELLTELAQVYPSSKLAGCSTAGEITASGVMDGGVVLTEVYFDTDVIIDVITARVGGIKASFDAGVALASKIKVQGLKAVLLLSPGVNINGSAIIEGLTSVIGDGVPISGGLAADGIAFETTATLTGNGVNFDQLCAVCFYGDALKIECGSFGGWEHFGPLRKVTRCEGNILYELDDKPALELYKQYLGEYASELPSSGLLFPFEMVSASKQEQGLIRTILGVDEDNSSLILAGDIDPDGYLRLMHTTIDGLIDGAENAVKGISRDDHDRLAILVSCVGRKLVMGDSVTEEVEAVNMILGDKTLSTGFYSYGEICPDSGFTQCSLHNQTMTVTVISE